MNDVQKTDLKKYIENTLDRFYQRRLIRLNQKDLMDFIKKKNPYLSAAQGLLSPERLAIDMVQSFAPASQETIFGNITERVAIYANNLVYGGYKTSSMPSIDLVFIKGKTLYFVSLKSGPDWGNADSCKAMVHNFKVTDGRHLFENVTRTSFVNACVYGNEKSGYKHGYRKYCGQDAWKFLTGDRKIHQFVLSEIAKAGLKAKSDYEDALQNKIVELFVELEDKFCLENGMLDWSKIAEINLERKPKRKRNNKAALKGKENK